jgi:hypothetical protein
MQPKTEQITTSFAPDTQFEIKPKPDNRAFEIPELLVIPLEEQPIRISLKSLERRGIPFSAIND